MIPLGTCVKATGGEAEGAGGGGGGVLSFWFRVSHVACLGSMRPQGVGYSPGWRGPRQESRFEIAPAHISAEATRGNKIELTLMMSKFESGACDLSPNG